MHDKSGNDSYKCKYDGCEEFVTANTWKHHMTTKHGDQRFEYDIYKKTFSRKDDVRLHILFIHDPTSCKFKCDVCGQKCVSKSVWFEFFFSYGRNTVQVFRERMWSPVCVQYRLQTAPIYRSWNLHEKIFMHNLFIFPENMLLTRHMKKHGSLHIK